MSRTKNFFSLFKSCFGGNLSKEAYQPAIVPEINSKEQNVRKFSQTSSKESTVSSRSRKRTASLDDSSKQNEEPSITQPKILLQRKSIRRSLRDSLKNFAVLQVPGATALKACDQTSVVIRRKSVRNDIPEKLKDFLNSGFWSSYVPNYFSSHFDESIDDIHAAYMRRLSYRPNVNGEEKILQHVIIKNFSKYGWKCGLYEYKIFLRYHRELGTGDLLLFRRMENGQIWALAVEAKMLRNHHAKNTRKLRKRHVMKQANDYQALSQKLFNGKVSRVFALPVLAYPQNYQDQFTPTHWPIDPNLKSYIPKLRTG